MKTITFRGEITKETTQSLIDKITALQVDEICLEINESMGGGIIPAFHFIDFIASSKIKLHTKINGNLAGSAVIWALSGEFRSMGRHQQLMFTEPAISISGPFREEYLKMFKIFTELTSKTCEFFKKASGNNPEFANALEDLRYKDIFFDSESCLKYDLIDEIF